MATNKIFENFQKNYSNQDGKYQYTTLVQHQSKIVAFAINDQRYIQYTVLDSQAKNTTTNQPNAFLDVNHFSASPQTVPFSNEIIQAGFEAAGTVQVPTPTKKGVPNEGGKTDKIYQFQSSTARLSELAPFQVLSVGQYIYLFRQSVASTHPDKVTASNGTSVVDQSLLVDRFILAGGRLVKKTERRYQRSKNKVVPRSSKDSLNKIDMDGNLFYEPTHEIPLMYLDGTTYQSVPLSQGLFSVNLIPTNIPKTSRWQIFVYSEQDQSIHSFNIKQAQDGLFQYDQSQFYFAFALKSGKAVTRAVISLASQLYYQQEVQSPEQSSQTDGRVLLAMWTAASGESAQITAIDFSATAKGVLVPCPPVVNLATQESYIDKMKNYTGAKKKIIDELESKIPQNNGNMSYQTISDNIDKWKKEIRAKESEKDNDKWKSKLNDAYRQKAQQEKLLKYQLEKWVKDKFVKFTYYNGDILNEYTSFYAYTIGALKFQYKKDANNKIQYDQPEWRCDWVQTSTYFNKSQSQYRGQTVTNSNFGQLINEADNKFYYIKNLPLDAVVTLYSDSRFEGDQLSISKRYSDKTNKVEKYYSGSSSYGMPEDSAGLNFSEFNNSKLDQKASSFVISLDPQGDFYTLTVKPNAKKLQDAIDTIAKYEPVRNYIETRQNLITQEKNKYQSAIQQAGSFVLEKMKSLRSTQNGTKQADVTKEISALQELFQTVAGGLRLDPLSEITCSKLGQKNFGAILPITGDNTTSGLANTLSLMNSGSGELTLYYQEGASQQFNSLHYDCRATRIKHTLTTDKEQTFYLVSCHLGAGYKGLKFQIDNDADKDPSLCQVTLVQGDLKEVWKKVPRAVKRFEQVINGKSSQYSSTNVSVTHKDFTNIEQYAPTQSGSLIARIWSNNARGAVPNKTQGSETNRIQSCTWVAAQQGTALNFEGSQYLGVQKGDTTEPEQFAIPYDMTAEMWIFPKKNITSPQCLMFSRQQASGDKKSKSFMISLNSKKPTNVTNYKTGEQYRLDVDMKGVEYMTNSAGILAEQWNHVAVSYKQSYGLNFNGSSSNVDFGNDSNFDIQNDMAIGINFQASQVDCKQYLLSKGSLAEVQITDGCPYAVYIDADNKINLEYQLKIASGNQKNAQNTRKTVTITSTDAVITEEPHQVAITRQLITPKLDLKTDKFTDQVIKDMQASYFKVRIFVDGVAVNLNGSQALDPTVWISPNTKPQVLTNSGSLKLGVGDTGGTKDYFKGRISELRLWKQALTAGECQKGFTEAPTPSAAWLFKEGQGTETIDQQNQFQGTLNEITWAEGALLNESEVSIYINGALIPTTPTTLSKDFQTARQFMLGGYLDDNNNLKSAFQGKMVEVRLWSQFLTQENILDHMFRPLIGNPEGILAYYPAQGIYENLIRDKAGNQDILDLPFTRSKQAQTLPSLSISTAPIGTEIPIMKDAIVPIAGQYQIKIGGNAAAQEYIDVQMNPRTLDLSVIMKRCYSYISETNEWCLVCGYKVEELEKEWVAQTQGNLKLIGYVEGAPPTPCENLTTNDPDTQSYECASSIEFQQASDCSYAYEYSGLQGDNIQRMFRALVGVDTEWDAGDIIIKTKVFKVKVNIGYESQYDETRAYEKTNSAGQKYSKAQNLNVAFSGYWEAASSDKSSMSYVRDWPRRFLAKNEGTALVKSKTIDIYALRTKGNKAVVQYLPIANPDIPEDWNLIPFKLKNTYTKQGTLDGLMGNNVWDPDYEQLATNEKTTKKPEFSYYKPSEAYAIKQKILKEESLLSEDYDNWKLDNTQYAKGEQSIQADPSSEINKSKRNIVNTYLWTASGGLMTEETQTMDVYEEAEISSWDSTFNRGVAFDADASFGGINVPVINLSALWGTTQQKVTTKTKNSEYAFNLSVDLSDVERDIQEYDSDGNRVYYYVGSDGKQYEQANLDSLPQGVKIVETVPKFKAGKVDAYRFMSFYLRPSVDNWSNFQNIVDSNWLDSQDRNAIALRQAMVGGNANPQLCWRIFHRVTFVSRVVGADDQNTTPQTQNAVENKLASLNYESSWQLIEIMKPYYTQKKQALNAGGELTDQQKKDAVAEILETYLPEFSDHVDEITPMFLYAIKEPLNS